MKCHPQHNTHNTMVERTPEKNVPAKASDEEISAAERYLDDLAQRVNSSESLAAFARKLFAVFHR